MCVDVVQNPKIAAVTIEVLAEPASRIREWNAVNSVIRSCSVVMQLPEPLLWCNCVPLPSML